MALVTLLAVALLGVEQGIAVAVALAILDRTRLGARTHLRVLGRIPSTTSWVPVNGAERAVEAPGVLVISCATPLWYANATHFTAEMTAAINRPGRSLGLVVLDSIGMTDVDYTGSRELRRLLEHLDRDGLSFAMARTNHGVRAALARSGLLAQIGADHLFDSVDEAVNALHPDAPRRHGLAEGPADPAP